MRVSNPWTIVALLQRHHLDQNWYPQDVHAPISVERHSHGQEIGPRRKIRNPQTLTHQQAFITIGGGPSLRIQKLNFDSPGHAFVKHSLFPILLLTMVVTKIRAWRYPIHANRSPMHSNGPQWPRLHANGPQPYALLSTHGHGVYEHDHARLQYT